MALRLGSIFVIGKSSKINCWKFITTPLTMEFYLKYQPSGAGGTRSPPATPHRLQHLTAQFIQNGRRGLEICQTLCY